MLKKILIGLAVLVAIFLVVVAFQPAEFRVVRSEVIAASPEIVHGQIDDFANWKNWSPWHKMDTTMKLTLSSPSAGAGATYGWESEKMGAGNMRITASTPEQIDIDLNFTKPFKAENKTVFAMRPIHGGTQIFWIMTGRNNFVGKAMCLFMNMDKMVGGDFEKGLKDIKRLSEIQSGWRKE
jgi:hypothetical protein